MNALPPVPFRCLIVILGVCLSGAGQRLHAAPEPVYRELLSVGDTWLYWDAAEAPAPDWYRAEGNVDGWMEGRAPLGYGERDVETELSFGDDDSKKRPVYYFRKTLHVEDPGAWPRYSLLMRIDDGAVVYLNGEELDRWNIDGGEITHETWASGKTRAEQFYHYVRVPAERLVEGENLLAVSVHQADPVSSDMVLDAELVGDHPSERADDDPADGAALAERSEAIVRAVPGLEAATVSIGGGGSGVIVSADGLILSAAHVVDQFEKECDVYFSDGSRAKAESLGGDRRRDAGMFKLKGGGPWPFVEIRDTRLKQGEWVMALGHPQGFDEERGCPLRLGKVLRGNDARQHYLMTDCTVTGGDSGGPLFDMDGKLVGIHSYVSQSLLHNFHVPVEAFQRSWERMEKGEKFGRMLMMPNDESLAGDPGAERKAVLGVRLEAEEDENALRVSAVTEASAAAEAGLRPGDVIRQADDREIRTREELLELLAEKAEGDELALVLQRGEEEVRVTAVLGGIPAEPLTPESWMRQLREESLLGHKVASVFAPAASKVAASSLEVLSGEDEPVVMGVVVGAKGYVLTKASELPEDGKLRCRLADGRTLRARIVSEDPGLDLALLRVRARNLEPVAWVEADLPKGSMVMAPGLHSDSMHVGVVSTKPRVIERARGFLGVMMEEDDGKVRIRGVLDDGAAKKSGIKEGDVILKAAGEAVAAMEDFRRTIGSLDPGQAVSLVIRRGEEEMEIEVVLGDRESMMPRSANQMGGRFSERRLGFSSVIQHDLTLQPEHCGGLLLDVEGRAVGLNIARSSRIRSFALPASLVKTLLHTNARGRVRLLSEGEVVQRHEEIAAAEKALEEARAALREARRNLRKARSFN